MSKELSEFKKKMRQLMGDYVKSEGCSCCRDSVAHTQAEEKIGRLLNVRKYEDGSGYDFYRYASKKES